MGWFIPVRPTLTMPGSSCCQRSQNPGPTKGPLWPLQWKADGCSRDGSRLQSAVQERKLLIRCHPSSGQAVGWRGVWRKDRVAPDTQRLASFKRLHMAHLGLRLACKTHTHPPMEGDSCSQPTHSEQWMYSGSYFCCMPFISGIIPFSIWSVVKGCFWRGLTVPDPLSLSPLCASSGLGSQRKKKKER